MVKILAI